MFTIKERRTIRSSLLLCVCDLSRINVDLLFILCDLFFLRQNIFLLDYILGPITLIISYSFSPTTTIFYHINNFKYLNDI